MRCWLDTAVKPVVTLPKAELEEAGGAISLASHITGDPTGTKQFYLFMRLVNGSLSKDEIRMIMEMGKLAEVRRVIRTRVGDQFLIVSREGQGDAARGQFCNTVLTHLNNLSFVTVLQDTGEYSEFFAD